MKPWKDITTYRQGDTVREPTSYEQRGKHLIVSVHRLIFEPGRWFVSCYELRLDRRRLEALDVESAFIEAVDYVRDRAEAFLADAEKLKP